MALTLRRWIAAGTLGCGALAVALLPPAVNPRERRAWEREYTARTTIASALRHDHQLALYFRRRDEALAQLRRTPTAPTNRPSVLVDERRAGRVSLPYRDVVRAAVDSLARRFGPFDTTSPVVFFMTADTQFKAPGAAGWVGLEQWLYIFPEATDGRTCLVIVPTDRRGAGTLAEANSALGPCAYYAAFGMAGPFVTAWLQRMDHFPAIESDWLAPRPRAGSPDFGDELISISWAQALAGAAHYGLSLNASACAAGKLKRCDAYIEQLPWFLSLRSQRGSSRFMTERYTWRGGDESSWYLADLVREMGRDRFARFWRSPLPRDSAFAAAFGLPMNEWTHRWIADRRPSVRVGPTIRPTSTLLGLLLAIALVAGGAYYTLRRQVS